MLLMEGTPAAPRRLSSTTLKPFALCRGGGRFAPRGHYTAVSLSERPLKSGRVKIGTVRAAEANRRLLTPRAASVTHYVPSEGQFKAKTNYFLSFNAAEGTNKFCVLVN